MDNITIRNLFSGLTGAVLLASSASALADSSTRQMQACKIAVLEQSKFHDLPMAAVSVSRGENKKHPAFTVRWDGLKASGNCKVNKKGKVKKVNIKKFHDGRTGNRNDGNRNKPEHGGRAGNHNDGNRNKPEHGGRTGNHNGGNGNRSGNKDDFYYDRQAGKWRDPDGKVCHSCTPDNGFPRGGHSR